MILKNAKKSQMMHPIVAMTVALAIWSIIKSSIIKSSIKRANVNHSPAKKVLTFVAAGLMSIKSVEPSPTPHSIVAITARIAIRWLKLC